MRVVEYKTAVAGDWASLDEEVNRMLAQGWQLYGPPYCGGPSIGVAFTVAQALVKGGLREPMAPIETAPTSVIQP